MQIPFKKRLSSRLLSILISSIFFSSTLVGYFLYQSFHAFLYDRFSADLQKYIELTEQSLDYEKLKITSHRNYYEFLKATLKNPPSKKVDLDRTHRAIQWLGIGMEHWSGCLTYLRQLNRQAGWRNGSMCYNVEN